jgi:hypothetical protein
MNPSRGCSSDEKAFPFFNIETPVKQRERKTLVKYYFRITNLVLPVRLFIHIFPCALNMLAKQKE